MNVAAALMLKAPRPGFVKTRLAAEIGYERATEIYRKLVEHQIQEVPQTWSLSVHFAPANAYAEMATWLAPAASDRSIRMHAQCEGDLGERMLAAVEQEIADGADAVVLVGGDCPGLTRQILYQVEERAKESDVVIVPACDGGYVAMLVKAAHHVLFRGLPWSTSDVCQRSVRAAESANLMVAMLPSLSDIDDVQSLRAIKNTMDFGISR